MFYLMMHQHILFTVIWHETYDKGPFRMRESKPTDRIAHTMASVTPVVDHWLEREIAQ